MKKINHTFRLAGGIILLGLISPVNLNAAFEQNQRCSLSARIAITVPVVRQAFHPGRAILPGAEKQPGEASWKSGIINEQDLSTGRKWADILKEVQTAETPRRGQELLFKKALYTAFSVLDHPTYKPYLNLRGRDLLSRCAALLRRVERESFRWDDAALSELKSIAAGVPGIDNLHEELFVEVFPGWTDEQIRVFFLGGYDYLSLQLSDNCLNRCIFCALDSGTGRLHHMPLPLLSKIFRRAKAFPPVNGERNVLLYFKSDIIQYRDPVINATVGDAYRLAADNGFTSNTPVSHGNGDQGKEDQLGWIIKNLDRKFTFSFHAYHIPVKKYALDKVGGALSPAESAGKKEALIEKYTRRFTPLLSAAIAHNKLANIRILAHGALLKYILGKSGDNKYAAAVLKEIQGVQEQVWKHIRKNILRGNLHADINDYVRKNGYGELKPYSIYWSGRAEKFLLELGVEPRVIRELRKNEEMIFGEGKSSRIVAPDFFLLAEPDGSISLQLAEDSGTRFRAVSEIFRGSQDEQFRLFADFLTIIYRTVRASPAGRSAPVKVSAENLTPGTRDILLDKLKIGKDDLKRPLYFTLEETKNNSGIGYYQLLFKFLAPDNRLEKLLAGQLNSRTLETLYLTLKDLPVPVSINFFVNVGNDRALMLRHRLIRGNHPALRKIAGVTVRSFPTGKRIFSPAEDNGSAAIPVLNPGTPLSGPVVSRPLPEPLTPGISLFDYAV